MYRAVSPGAARAAGRARERGEHDDEGRDGTAHGTGSSPPTSGPLRTADGTLSHPIGAA